LLVAAGLGAPNEHAVISLLAINGLRISEALGADIEVFELDRGHRTLTILRKGDKTVTIPLAPRTARAIDLESANASKDRPSFDPTGSAWTGTAPAASWDESSVAPESTANRTPHPPARVHHRRPRRWRPST